MSCQNCIYGTKYNQLIVKIWLDESSKQEPEPAAVSEPVAESEPASESEPAIESEPTAVSQTATVSEEVSIFRLPVSQNLSQNEVTSNSSRVQNIWSRKSLHKQ